MNASMGALTWLLVVGMNIPIQLPLQSHPSLPLDLSQHRSLNQRVNQNPSLLDPAPLEFPILVADGMVTVNSPIMHGVTRHVTVVRALVMESFTRGLVLALLVAVHPPLLRILTHKKAAARGVAGRPVLRGRKLPTIQWVYYMAFTF